MNLDDLTESMKRKTLKIIKKDKHLKELKKAIYICNIFFIISLILILICNDAYIKYAISIFDFSNTTVSYQLNFIEIIILICFILSLVINYYQQDKHSRLKKEYDSLRVDIMKQMDQSFCLHGEGCNCKDKYIKDLEEIYDIDIVFKL